MLSGLADYGSDSDNEQPTSPDVKKSPTTKKRIFKVELPKGASDTATEEPAVKRSRPNGARGSALLGMLPVPKNATPVKSHVSKIVRKGFNPAPISEPEPSEDDVTTDLAATISSTSSAPPRDDTSAETTTAANEALPNFFALEISRTQISGSSQLSSSVKTAISSAPSVKDFEPPEPTPADPYPGYYQLPNGQWTAHDPTYYQTFYERWKAEWDSQNNVQRGFEGAEGRDTVELTRKQQMDEAQKEREEKKAITKNIKSGPTAPNMNIQGAKLGRTAHTRHQLTTLLTEAYQNREALEERIAEARRNRKESGMKYGF